MTKSDAGVLSYASQARAVFVTKCALMVVKVRMTLGGCEKAHCSERSSHGYQRSANVSTGKFELAWK